MHYTWSQTNCSLTIQIFDCSDSAEVFVSSTFIRVTDPKQKKVIALDLAHSVLFKEKFAPVIRRGRNEVCVTIVKGDNKPWDELLYRLPHECRSTTYSRRSESIKDAEEYYAALKIAASNSIEELRKVTRIKMLEERQRINDAREQAVDQRVEGIRQQVDHIIIAPRSDPTRDKNLTDCPVRQSVGVVKISVGGKET